MAAGRMFSKIAAVLLSTLFALCIAEAVARFAAFSGEERKLGAEGLWRRYTNEYVPALNPSNDCSFFESLTAHAQFGTVYHRIPPCGNPHSNNLGLPDRSDYPAERDGNYFTIAVLGGSVASFLAVGKSGAGSWIEDILNRDYRSPNGKPFRIVSGALGGWSYPNQLTFLTLYGEAVDAVLAVDGFNEALKVERGFPLHEQEPMSFLTAARPPHSFWTQRLVILPFHIRRISLANPVLEHSFLAFLVFRGALAVVTESKGQLKREQDELVSRYYAFPKDWTKEKIRGWNTAKYETYIRMLRAESETLGIRYAHFVQPMLSIGKNLTPEEEQIRRRVDPGLYQSVFIEVSNRLSARGYHTASLDSVFSQERGTIYSDEVHSRFGPVNGDNKGYSLISDAIAKHLARMWGLKHR